MIARAIPKIVQAFKERAVITCSTADLGTSALGPQVATVYTATSFGGDIIDRLGVELAGRRFHAVAVQAYAYTTLGTTEANCYSQITVRLQHGASSNGGDMADYGFADTTPTPTRSFGATAMTTPMYMYTTAAVSLVQTPPTIYNLQQAGRFLRTMVSVTKNPATTVTSTGWEAMRLGGVLGFLAADELPDRGNTTGAFTTSTSTST